MSHQHAVASPQRRCPRADRRPKSLGGIMWNRTVRAVQLWEQEEQ